MSLDTTLSAILHFGAFIFLAFVFWIIPGLKLIPIEKEDSLLDKIFLAVTFGFSLFAFFIYAARLLQIPFWIAYIPFLLLSAFSIRKLRKEKLSIPKLSNSKKVFFALILAGVLIQGVVLMKSAVRTREGIRFLEISAHDSLQHIYLINELKENFPPRHPGFSPILVNNYHFLFDNTIASLAKYLPLSTIELYYRIIPAFTSVLLSLGVFVFTRRLTKSEWSANIAVFLVLFGGNAAWFVKFFRGPEFQVNANSFMLDPIIDLMQNPIAILVFPLLLAGILCMQRIEKKPSLRWMIISATVFGTMIGFKSWGGILVLAALPVAALWMSISKKRHEFWLLWIIALAISLVIFLPIYETKTAANPVFAPGWLLKRMVEDADRFNKIEYFFLEQHYRETKNVLGLVKINLEQIGIYILGNLWLRIIGFVYLAYLLKKKTATAIFMSVVVMGSLFLPLLFNQGRKAYDIIQFGPYALLLLSIFTAATIQLTRKIFHKKLYTSLIIFFLLLSVFSNSKSLTARFTSNTFLISNEELEGYRFLQEKTSLESTLIVYPTDRNDAILLAAALSHRPTYFSGKSFAIITGEQIEIRNKEWRGFFEKIDPQRRRNLVWEGSIDYLLLTREEDEAFIPEGLNLKRVFANDKVIIYKIK